MVKLAVISSHPIQYNAPIFAKLSLVDKLQLKVFYTWGQAKGKVYDPGFGKEREWDIPLLEGYDYEFLNNVSANPGSHHFKGIINPGIIKAIEHYNPDYILVFGWSFKSHLKVLRYFHKRKIILFRGDSTLLDEPAGFSVKKIIRRVFLKWVYALVDYAFYTGQENKKYFSKHGLKNNQLLFMPHAVNNDAFSAKSEEYEAAALDWRNELGIGKDEFVFLFAGKFEKKKDPLLLIKSFRLLALKDIRLIMVGNGMLEKEMKALSGSDKRIIFLPFQNQQKMPVVYRLGNVFVLPSCGPGETWGLAVNEAMACKRAVIVSTKCGCAKDLVAEKNTGFVFDAGNLISLQNKLEFFLQNRQTAYEYGINGYTIIDNWNYENAIGAVEKAMNLIPVSKPEICV